MEIVLPTCCASSAFYPILMRQRRNMSVEFYVMRWRRNMSVELCGLHPMQFLKQIKKLTIANQAACFHHFEQLLFSVAVVCLFMAING